MTRHQALPTDWINNPDPEQYPSWWAFIRQLFWDYQLGEAFVLATAWYSNDYPARFHVVPPWMVQVDMDGAGLPRYKIGNSDVTAEILHIWYQKTVGEAHGHGPLEAGAARLIAANALSRYAGTLASAGGIPNAVLVHPNNLTGTQARDLQSAWVESRMSSMGLPAVLSGGIDFKTLSFSPKDMALIDLAQFNESRIAVLLGVPPFLQGLPSRWGFDDVQQRAATVRISLAGRPVHQSGRRHASPVRLAAAPRHHDRTQPGRIRETGSGGTGDGVSDAVQHLRIRRRVSGRSTSTRSGRRNGSPTPPPPPPSRRESCNDR